MPHHSSQVSSDLIWEIVGTFELCEEIGIRDGARKKIEGRWLGF